MEVEATCTWSTSLALRRETCAFTLLSSSLLPVAALPPVLTIVRNRDETLQSLRSAPTAALGPAPTPCGELELEPRSPPGSMLFRLSLGSLTNSSVSNTDGSWTTAVVLLTLERHDPS